MIGNIQLRLVEEHELDKAIVLEKRCYPPEAAATIDGFRFRFLHYRDYFWTAWSGDRLIGITNGIRTNQAVCGDEMKGDQSDDRNGSRFCILTIAVDPNERRKGIGSLLLRELIAHCKSEGIVEIILMCEKHLISFYEAEQFKHKGVSASTHGGIVWHEMSRDLHTMEHLTE